MNKFPKQNLKKTRTTEIASVEVHDRAKALTRLLRCATVLRVTPPARYG